MSKYKFKLHFQMMNHSNKYILLLICLLLVACNVRYLPPGEKLYNDVKIKIVSTENVSKGKIKTVVKTAIRPNPNKRYLGMHPQFWFLSLAGKNPKGKLKRWFKKVGGNPILISNVNAAATGRFINAKLFNIGIFDCYTESEFVEKRHTAKVIYTVHVHKPYKVKDVTYNISDDSLKQILVLDKDNSLINAGDDYSLDKLRAERTRIDALLKDKGYFYFNPDYLIFKADTSAVNHTISFAVSLKDSITKSALTVYRINQVYVNQNYSLRDSVHRDLKDSLIYQNTIFVGKASRMNIKPKVIYRSIYLRKNTIYSRKNHNTTLNRLMSMGCFKFVQVKFSSSDTIAKGYLNVTILLTPMTNYTFRSEMDLVSKSNNYNGPRLNLSVLNRNTFKGAEILNLSLAGSFEAQLSGANKNLFSYSFNPQIELTFPQILTPFNMKLSNSLYLPKTSILISYNFLKRVSYFNMNTLQIEYAFKWKKNIKLEHELAPISINFSSVGNKSPLFIAMLDSNSFLKKSYEEQFIVGCNYSFTYNEQVIEGKKMQYYLHFATETAGNLLSLAKIIGGKKPTSDHPSKVIGSIYSQYAKLSLDGRAYYSFNKNNKLVLRLFAGVGDAYGNSSVLPYNKQFFSGGPSSIRAFQINSIGPGTYHQKTDGNVFLELGGDIKLEMNGEYRFGIYKLMKGALFIDAGNVWLQKSNTSNVGTPFAIPDFMHQLAVGAGVGLRFDVSFFVLRFDLAIPLREPWLEDNHRWVINKINFGSAAWRSNNLVLNVAIGYPF